MVLVLHYLLSEPPIIGSTGVSGSNSNPTGVIVVGKDVYKRTLAECFVNGESLSKFLVRSGYAFAYRKYSTKFIEDENFAKANKLGMWAMIFQYPWDFRKTS